MFEIDKVAETLIELMHLFNCDMETAWKKYMHDLIKSQFSYDEVKEYINNTNIQEGK